MIQGFTVGLKPHDFFGHVGLLGCHDHLLLEAGRVHRHAEVLNLLAEALPDGFDLFVDEGGGSLRMTLEGRSTVPELFLQARSLRSAGAPKSFEGRCQRLEQRLSRTGLHVLGEAYAHGVRQGKEVAQSHPPSQRARLLQLRGQSTERPRGPGRVADAHRLLTDQFESDPHLDAAAGDAGPDLLAAGEVVPQEGGGEVQGYVQPLVVQPPDFDENLDPFRLDFGASVTRHAFHMASSVSASCARREASARASSTITR